MAVGCDYGTADFIQTAINLAQYAVVRKRGVRRLALFRKTWCKSRGWSRVMLFGLILLIAQAVQMLSNFCEPFNTPIGLLWLNSAGTRCRTAKVT